MWHKNTTPLNTSNDFSSSEEDIFNAFKDPELIQVAIIKLLTYPTFTTLKKITKESIAEIDTNKLVKI